MNDITICYSTHRPETLGLTTRIMREYDLILLEEPVHPDFSNILNGTIELEEYVLELDAGYPAFTLGQYRLLQELHALGKEILQVEPYLDHLLNIQFFLAEDHSPDEIQVNTVSHSVYCAERAATGLLIDYYKTVQGSDFELILSTMNSFAQADAARFVLRDSLRAERIVELVIPGKTMYIEAGSIHLLLYTLLRQKLPQDLHLRLHSIDKEAIKILHLRGSIFSPGDQLTLMYIYGRKVRQVTWQLLCAQSLIYSKIIQKEELWDDGIQFPHTENEITSITAVKQLAIEDCRVLFQQIRRLSSEDAADVVENSLKRRGLMKNP